MAIWQYQIFVLPKEEIDSYFSNLLFINEEALNEVNWWKYRQLTTEYFENFKSILPLKKSWSDDIVLFGDENSNCIELLTNKGKIVEIMVRIDLRFDYTQFLDMLCEFAQEYNCILLNYSFKILSPVKNLVNKDIESYPIYKSFLNKMKDDG